MVKIIIIITCSTGLREMALSVIVLIRVALLALPEHQSERNMKEIPRV